MDIPALVGQMMPYVMTAIGAYGGAVLTKAQDLAADESVSLGRRLLQRLLKREENRPGIEAAIRDAVEFPEDEDFQSALRGQLKKALTADSALAADLARMLASSIAGSAGGQTVSGSFIGGDNIQIGQARDVTIDRR
ncbi:hypothetical protein OHA25_08220 [Nonomuraea sp. NBC_00507]|uniref:hypothetical protein n=1 Tax=Nonomuraea sp. NBC_00507 TaxID=2976002 RepID=UPI002E173975